MTTDTLTTDPADHPVIDGPWWRDQAALAAADGRLDLVQLCHVQAALHDRKTVIRWEVAP